MAHVGTLGCRTPACSGTAAVSQSTSGVVNVKCPFCSGSTHYGVGSKGARNVLAAMTKAEADDAPADVSQSRGPAKAKGSGLLIG